MCRDCAENKKKEEIDKTKLTIHEIESSTTITSVAATTTKQREKRPLEGKSKIRSLRTKKRKLRLNELYFKLAQEVGMKISVRKNRKNFFFKLINGIFI